MIIELGGRSTLEVRRDLHRALEALRPKARRIQPSDGVQAIERARLRAKVHGTAVLSGALRKALEMTRRDVLGRLGLREAAGGIREAADDDDDATQAANAILAQMSPADRKKFHAALAALGMDEGRLAEAFGPAIEAMYESGRMSAIAELGVSLEMNPARALAALQTQTLEFSKTVIDREREGLRATLAEGIAAGDSAPGIGTRIREYFADGLHYVDESTGAVTRIVPDDTWIEQVARTETSRAHTAGVMDAFESAGVEKIMWLAAEDDRTCDDCEPTDGEVIAMGDSFDNVDVDAPPAHPSCRCTVVSVGFTSDSATSSDDEDD
jgi:SPP1 gp7 family putative phage head morphogenesis protein